MRNAVTKNIIINIIIIIVVRQTREITLLVTQDILASLPSLELSQNLRTSFSF